MDPNAETHTLDELRAHLTDVTERIKLIDSQHVNRDLAADAQAEWDQLRDERIQTEKSLRHREERELYLTTLAGKTENTETDESYRGPFQTRKPSRVPADPTNLHEYRSLSTSMDDLEQAYRDGAMKIVDGMRSVHPDMSTETAQGNVGRMLDTIDKARAEDGTRSLARRIIATSSRGYEREFETYMRTQGRVVGAEMERAASLTTTAGGYAVPVSLDPTVILVSSGVINPIRQLARVQQTTVNTVEFISSTSITAAYNAEATEASDNTPSLAQPTANIEKAFAFVPMSIEIAEDWAAIQTSMAMMFSDAKDVLENTKFLTGLGHASHEPQGLIAVGGATAVVTSASTATMALADLYSLENALSPRFRARATVVGNRAAFQKVRGFATAAGPSAWTDSLRVGNPDTLLGYPAREWSAYSSAVTTTGSTVLTIGDFNQFAIVDRVGMSVEFIPHLFGGSNRYPTGQRGLYCYWRNSSQVLTPGLQANSGFVSLKLL